MTLAIAQDDVASGPRSRALVPEFALYAFWIGFLCIIVRPNVLPDVNSLAWAGADLVALLAVAREPQLLGRFIARNKLLVAWPVLATLSFIWSASSSHSLYHGIQFGMNVLASFAFYRMLGLKRMLIALFVFGLLMQLASTAMYVVNYPGVIAESGLRGIYQHKNELGMYSTLQIITATSLFLAGWRRWLCVLGAALAVFLLLRSLSGTSMLLTVALCGLFPIAAIVRRSISVAGMLAGLAIAAIAGFALVVVITGFNPIEAVLNALGKDSTLTGRNVLWQFGIDTVLEHPFLGVGFLGYWNSWLTSAAYLLYVMDQALVAFHNVYIEVAVGTGLIGLTLFVSTLAMLAGRGILFAAREGTGMALWPFVYTVWIVLLCASENPVFWNSSFQFLLGASAAVTCGALPIRAAAASRG